MTGLSFGSACECVGKEQRPDRYMAWVVTFRDLGSGRTFEVSGGVLPGDEPAVTVGRRYRVEVDPVDLEEK